MGKATKKQAQQKAPTTTTGLGAIAVGKLLSKIEGERPSPGDYRIFGQYLVTVDAEVKIGEDHEYTPTVAIPLKAALALVLEKSGFTRERSAELLVEAMTEAIEGGKKAESAVADKLLEVEIAMDRVAKQIAKKLPKRVRKGRVCVDGTVNVDAARITVHEIE